jgi:hypothetical protein
MVLGLLIAVDGLLPMRSVGPNPSWIEFVLGIVICSVGWFVRRLSFRKAAGM